MGAWWTAFRVRRLRRAKLLRIERFKLACDRGDMDLATRHRRRLWWYCQRIAALTGEPETLTRAE
jgi:hypothetical protein